MKVTGLISIQGEVSIHTKQEGTYRNRLAFETVARQIAKWGLCRAWLQCQQRIKCLERQIQGGKGRQSTKWLQQQNMSFFILRNNCTYCRVVPLCVPDIPGQIRIRRESFSKMSKTNIKEETMRYEEET